MKKNVIECGKGWESLYKPIVEMIIDHDSKKTSVDEQIGVGQVKEKWGALEIYPMNTQNLTPTLKEAITDAYIKSKQTCEYCGETKHVGTTMNHWSKTCCKACWETNITPTHKDSRWKDLETKIIYKQENNGE